MFWFAFHKIDNLQIISFSTTTSRESATFQKHMPFTPAAKRKRRLAIFSHTIAPAKCYFRLQSEVIFRHFCREEKLKCELAKAQESNQASTATTVDIQKGRVSCFYFRKKNNLFQRYKTWMQVIPNRRLTINLIIFKRACNPTMSDEKSTNNKCFNFKILRAVISWSIDWI